MSDLRKIKRNDEGKIVMRGEVVNPDGLSLDLENIPQRSHKYVIRLCQAYTLLEDEETHMPDGTEITDEYLQGLRDKVSRYHDI